MKIVLATALLLAAPVGALAQARDGDTRPSTGVQTIRPPEAVGPVTPPPARTAPRESPGTGAITGGAPAGSGLPGAPGADAATAPASPARGNYPLDRNRNVDAQGAGEPSGAGISGQPTVDAAGQGRLPAQLFVHQVAASDLMEIETSKLARDKARSERVRQFAQHMITDHQQSSQELRQIAGTAMMPAELTNQQALQLEDLRLAPLGRFDDLYMGLQIEAHRAAIQVFQTYAERGEDERLRQWAQQKLPILQQHLQTATDVARVGLR